VTGNTPLEQTLVYGDEIIIAKAQWEAACLTPRRIIDKLRGRLVSAGQDGNGVRARGRGCRDTNSGIHQTPHPYCIPLAAKLEVVLQELGGCDGELIASSRLSPYSAQSSRVVLSPVRLRLEYVNEL
jgi:hypothetical protein